MTDKRAEAERSPADETPPDGYQLDDPASLAAEVERVRLQNEAWKARETAEQDRRERERLEAHRRNEAATAAQRAADTTEAQRRVADARARAAAGKADAPAPPTRQPSKPPTGGDRRQRGRGSQPKYPKRRAATPPSGPELTAAVEAARTVAEHLAALAAWCWWDAGRGGTCPADAIPTLAALAAWLPECPAAEPIHADLPATLGFDPWRWMPTRDGADIEAVNEGTPRPVPPPPLPGPTGLVGYMVGALTLAAPLTVVLAQWRTLPEPRPAHPLAAIMAAWQRRPQLRPTEDRTDRRILPSTLHVVGPSAERERGLQIGGLVDDRATPELLPLFPELPAPTRYRVPLLEVTELATPLRSRGQGAPVPARLLVRGGLLLMRPEDRGLLTVRIAVTVGELLDALWPPTVRRTASGGTRYARDDARRWPKLLDALHRARDLTIPVLDDGRPARWFPIALRQLPDGYAGGALPPRDGRIILDLAPPPGATSGPTVDLPWLDRMGVTSGPAWCAYIAARTLIWLPGRTRRIVPATGRWAWSRNPDDYPVLTPADLCRHAFGATDRKNRSRAEILAPWEALPDVTAAEATDRRTGARGWRLMPVIPPSDSRVGPPSTGEHAPSTGEHAPSTGEHAPSTGETRAVNRGNGAGARCRLEPL